MYLRQSTASQEILLGRFLDPADGDTEVTGLTIANTDIKLHKAGATTLANKNSGGATHIANGLYYAVLDATDTNTLGNLEIHVHVAGALAIRRGYIVLPANVYDSLVLGSDLLSVDPAVGSPGPPTLTEITEAVIDVLSSAIADSSAAVGSRPSVYQALLMMTRFLMTERTFSGGTLTIYKEDGSTPAMTFTADSATAPTTYTRAT